MRRARRRARDQQRLLRSDAKPVGERGGSYIGRDVSVDGRASARRGPGYERFVATGWPGLIASGDASRAQAADDLATSEANVSRWMAAWTADEANRLAREDWVRDVEVDEALVDPRRFMARFFPDLDYAPFYDEWEAEIEATVGTGSRLLLLAPQRHTKTETLIRWCLRKIATDPNVCILWVSRSKELAEESVGMLRQLLEEGPFAEAVLGPGGTFVPPPRSGKSWTNEQFTVANRTRVRKSPTVRALGIGGTTSGRDADIIIVDDPQEREDCDSPTTREKQFRWFVTTLLARKMERTGVAVLTSRRHIEDIPGRLIRDHDGWRVLTYQAHDPACPIPEADVDAHVDCVLWPRVRTFRFLMEKKADDPAFFACNYQNQPRADTRVLVTPEDLDRCKDHMRPAGRVPDAVSELYAGIDPADAKPVAGMLWGYEHYDEQRHPASLRKHGRRHIIDYLEATPGIRGGREILRTWHERFGVRRFVVEKNMAQSWWLDTEISDYTARNGIQIIPHYTSASSKWDAKQGVTAMFELMRTVPTPAVTIPWGDAETRQRMERLLRAFLVFDPDYLGNKHADDDLIMAGWFPQPRMDGLNRDLATKAVVEYPQTPYAWRTGYPTRTGYPNRDPEAA